MSEAVFRAKAPKLMSRLISAFNFSVEDAAAIAGNAGHESNGLSTLQEIAPTVAGSRGGYGWFQWTGPRRKAFEAYARSKRLPPSSDEANTAFLIFELKTSHKAAVGKTKAAPNLEAKVEAFEATYERAGVKHYDQRERWARIALQAYQAQSSPGPKTTPTKWAIAGAGGTLAGTVAATAADSFASSAGYGLAGALDWRGLLVIGVLIGLAAVITLVAIGEDRRERLWDRLFG